MREKILVSACLAGELCRWHGKRVKSTFLKKFVEENPEKEYVLVCPELLGGLGVPRKPVKRVKGKVFETCAEKQNRKNVTGKEVTDLFLEGAEKVLKICKRQKINRAILCNWSPSCDVNGITGKLLKRNGIEIKNTW